MADDNDNDGAGTTGPGAGQPGSGQPDAGQPDSGQPGEGQPSESLLPYDLWTEEALRHVVASALTYVAANGLPGEHHIYLTFRTDYPGVVIPPRLRAQYPQEMTIVLQHQFWNLSLDEATRIVTIGLSFSGVPSTLQIPLVAVTGFADPHVRYGLRFRPPEPAAPPVALPAPVAHVDTAETDDEPDGPAADPTPQVVSLDAFRRRSPPKESA